MSGRSSALAGPLAWLRAHGWAAASEAVANFAAPVLVYDLAAARLGSAGALMAAAVPPIVWSVIQLVRKRRLDAISLMVLSGITLSLLAFAGGGGIRMLQLRETLVGGLVGTVFLGSVAAGRPLIHVLARAGAQRRSQTGAQAIEASGGDPQFRRAMRVATLAWGFGLLGTCAVNVALVFAVPIRVVLLVAPPVSYAVLGLLTAWTFRFVPRALRAAQVRQAPGSGSSGGVAASVPGLDKPAG